MADEVFSFVDAGGTETLLSDETSGYRVIWGPLGRFMAPIAIDEAPVPLQAGAQVRQVRTLPRDVDLPVEVIGADNVEVRSRVRALLEAIDPNLGEGRLRVIGPDGQARDLRCRYESGAEGDESTNAAGITFQRVVLTFRGSDPFWYPASAQVVTMVLSGNTPTFFPIFPLRLTASEIFAITTAQNGGDWDASPVWTITGPGSAPILRNLTTGALLDLSGVSLSASEQITIDTRPGHKRVTDAAGMNRFGDLSDASTLFALAPGSNNLQVEMSGATSASQVVLTYFEPYRSV